MESITHAQDLIHWSPFIQSQIGLGLVACYRGENKAAWSYFLRALDTTQKIGDVLSSLNAIVGIAQLLMTEAQETQALELLMYLRSHPVADWEMREKAEQTLNQLKGTLSTERFTQAEAQAKTLRLDVIIDSLLSKHLNASEDESLSLDKPTKSANNGMVDANQTLREPLTRRELQVLKLVASGLRDRQIADQLYIEVSTVKKHNSQIRDKLGANNRTQAVNRARELHLL